MNHKTKLHITFGCLYEGVLGGGATFSILFWSILNIVFGFNSYLVFGMMAYNLVCIITQVIVMDYIINKEF
ncbi:hypothetical protein C4577_02185 [Candidatus Parcubacteria bacterium]|nr:MAG: hypothetical protein C4577_02185 [Candidatus Parcubacteria bacterium]